MFLVAWWLTGVFLGWLSWAFYQRWLPHHRSRVSEADAEERLNTPIRKAWIAFLTSALTRYGFVVRPPKPAKGGPSSERSDQAGLSDPAPRWAFAAVAFSAVLVVAFAALTDQAQLDNYTLFVKAYLTGVRVQALAIGILSGFVFRQYRVQIAYFCRRIADAVIGSKENTAWALQSALAIGLIAIGIFAIRPDLLPYLRSFKLGTVEATFAEQGPLPLRDARLNLRDFRAKLFVGQFGNFEEYFLPEKTRGRAIRLLGNPTTTERWANETDRLTELVYYKYVKPVLSSVYCLQDIHALRTATHDPDLSGYVSAWEDFLLEVHRGEPLLTQKRLVSFLEDLRTRSKPFIERVHKLKPNCAGSETVIKDPAGVLTEEETANEILSHYQQALTVLGGHGEQSRAKLTLIVFEPYVTGAIADLISLISGEREKADFLLNILDGFPRSSELGTPGIINLYYQATDSQLNSVGSLPLELAVEQIEYAVRSAKNLMAQSEKGLKAPESVSTSFDKKMLTEIYDTFLQNSFVTQRAEVDVYVQSVLDGETVPEKHRQNWLKATSRLSAILEQRLSLPRIEIDAFPRTELSSFEGERARLADIDPEFILQANISIALSAILLSDGVRPNAQTCNASLFYVNEADHWVQPTAETYSPDKSLESRLHRLVGAVAKRVGDSCNWTDARGQSKVEESKAK